VRSASRGALVLIVTGLTGACASPAPAPRMAAPVSVAVAPAMTVTVPVPAAAAASPIPDRSGTDSITWRLPTDNGAFFLEISPDPAPVVSQQYIRLTLVVHDADGQPDPHARVQFNAWMPEHGHDMARRPRVTALGGGAFLAEGLLFTMRGEWELLVSVYSGARSGQARLLIHV